jgi:DNA-binding MarR family transcriptional regulator
MSSSSISHLEDHLGYWLRLVSNHVSHAFKAKVEAHGVTVAEWVVLRILFTADDINPSQIAEHLGMTRGAISKLVDRLVDKKLVRIRVEKSDRRFQSILLTLAGRTIVPKLASLADENDEEFFSSLNDKQRSQLAALLKQIVVDRGLKETPTT